MILSMAGAVAGAASRRQHPSPILNHQQPRRWLTKVRLKWVKNRGLDHIIDRDTDVKACCLLKDAISRSPTGFLPARSLSPLQKHLGLTVPVLRFLRRYPTLFQESPHPRFPSLPTFSLAPAALLLSRLESSIHSSDHPSAARRVARLLAMSRSRSLPVSSLHSLRYDLGLPFDFPTSLTSSFPDLLRLVSKPSPSLSLVSLPSDLAVSSLQLRHRLALENPSYRDLKKQTGGPLAFPMRFPRGYGGMKKVQAWMDDFHRLPYISPYEDASGIDPESDLMEKRVVGVLHELLGLTVHKKTKRNYLRPLREELLLPHKFTRVFTRYPGIFYLSLKCKTTTVVLREGYERGKLVDQHPLVRLRDKLSYVMRTGVLYRSKGLTKLALEEDETLSLEDLGKDMVEEQQMGDFGDDDEDEDGCSDECYEVDSDDEDDDSDDD